MSVKHVMIDLETMGIEPDAAIIAVGAVKFDPRATIGELGDEFYMRVSLESSMAAGMSVSASTILWWMKQSEEARAEFADQAELAPLQSVLNEFLIWYEHASMPTWGNGADFDLAILKAAYRKFDVVPPWGFRDVRCYRTVCAELPPVEYVKPVVAHNALHDANAQAVHLQKLYNFINQRG